MNHARRADARYRPPAYLNFLFPLLHANGRAQQTDTDKVGFHVGWGQSFVRDRLMSPLTYSSRFPSFKFVYWMNGNHHRFEYSYHRLIRSGPHGASRLFLGGSTYNFIATRQGFFHVKAYGNTESEYTSGEYLLTLNLSMMAEHTFESRHVLDKPFNVRSFTNEVGTEILFSF